jgi:hypothetical protein
MSLSVMTGSESCTQQGSCEAQLSIGGSPTRLGTATPSLGPVPGAFQEPPHPCWSDEDEAQGVPCAQAGNLQ